MIPFSRALATLSGVAALTLAGSAPASAAYWSHVDAVGDVVSQTDTYDEETGQGQEGEPITEPDNTDTDVTRVIVNHRTHQTVLKVRLRDITARSGFVVYDIRTDTRRYSVMQRLGTAQMFPAFDFTRSNGDRVRCTGVERSVDRVANHATVRIPRRCLGDPRWLRIGVGVAKFDAESENSFTFWADDALRAALVRDSLGLSPRVRRG